MQWGNALTGARALPAKQQRRHLGAALRALREGDADAIAGLDAGDVRTSLEVLVQSSIDIAVSALEEGAFSTALTILDLTTALAPVGETRLQGRLLAQEARVLRNANDLDLAAKLYTDLGRMAIESDDDELRARAALGLGVVARMRGNYPEARVHFEETLAVEARTPEIQAVHGLAHQGMLIVAATAGDFGPALIHGWAAYDAEPADSPRRTEMLINIASVCNLAGQFRAALNGYLTALNGQIARRLQLAAYGGAALASAQLGDRELLARITHAGESLLNESADVYEAIDLERELAEAWFRAGDEARANVFRTRAIEHARQRGFNEIEYKAEALAPHLMVVTAPVLSLQARRVAERLARPEPRELLVAITGRRDW